MYEYKVKVFLAATEATYVEQELNALGAEGWELIGFQQVRYGIHFYFKREKTTTPGWLTEG